MDKWDIARPSGVCAVTGRTLAEGEEYYAVIVEDGETFRRADYSLEAWTVPPEGAYCFFKSRVPSRQKKRRLFIDDELLVNFFLRLADETDPSRLQFRFVLALILMRKRLVRYEQTLHEAGREYWQMRLLRDPDAHRGLHRVYNPQLTDDQVAGVSAQLGAILHGDMGVFDQPAPDADGHADVA